MRHALFFGLALSLGAVAAFLAPGCNDGLFVGEPGLGGAGALCPNNLVVALNSEFCEKETKTIDCTLVGLAERDKVCGVAIREPMADLKRSSTVKEYAGAGAVVYDCFTPDVYPDKPTTPITTQMSGTVKIFSNGCESKLVKIEVFKVGKDGALGEPVGTPLTTASECQTNGVATDIADCGTRYECNFIYGNVPTDTELVVKTSGPNWTDFYDYNLYIAKDAVLNGEWKHNLRALAADDYNAIAQAAIGGPITAGNGAVAGEVHDCDDVRLENAIVAINQERKILTYFTSNEQHPLPDLMATGTSVLGIYAALDVAPGPVLVAAVGKVDGKVVTMGHYQARVFPNSVSIVTFHGVQPFQVP